MDTSKVYNGLYIEGGLRVVVETPDPLSNRMIRNRQRFDLVTNIEITRVVGHGHFTNTNEPYLALFGQYAPGKTIRLTASSQYYDAVKALIKGNVNNEDPNKPLKTPITVIASGEKMRGHGLLVNGLWVVEPDGSRREIVMPTGAVIESAADQSTTAENALL